MKLQTFCLISAIILAVSCVSEHDLVPHGEESAQEHNEPVMEKGVSVVKVSESLVAQIEDGDTGVFIGAGICSMRRLFPNGGEYEARRRKAGLHRWYIMEYAKDIPLTKASETLSQIYGVESVEGLRKIKASKFNDFNENSQWHYSNSKGYSSINVQPVWTNFTTGSRKVIVGVTDGGIDIDHEDLAAACRGVSHYNFVDNNSVIVADNHGTHVAGTIGAVNNNGIGICGIAGGDAEDSTEGVRLMSCQIFKGNKGASGADAIVWSADHGAVISQNSWGYDFDYDNNGVLDASEKQAALNAKISSYDKEAVDYFIQWAGCDNDGNQRPDSPMKGGVVIFAAGNDGLANGAPANYEPIIAVGSLDKDRNRASYSNYGSWVDIAAPGTDIYSTYPDNKYGTMTGTSMACPHVSGIAALIVSHFGGPGFTNRQLEEKLIKGADHVSYPNSQIGPLADAYGSMIYGHDEAPAKVEDMEITVRSNFLDISFVTTGNSNGVAAYGYTVFYGTDRTEIENTTAGNPGQGVKFLSVFPEVKAGQKSMFIIPGLDFEETYYLKMYAFSYGSSYSEESPITEVRTDVNTAPEISSDYSGSTSFNSYERAILNFVIGDPDGHDVTVDYTQGSTAEDFKAMTNGKWQMTITARSAEPGNYKAVITATDSYGMSSSYIFSYTILDNASPIVVKEIGNMLLTKSPASFTLDMTEYFSDPDGESLIYEISSSDNSVAFLNPNGNKVIGTVLKYGRADITITAKDARNTFASQSFIILAREGNVGFTAYPNPVIDILHIATGEDSTDTEITVSTASGKTVFLKTLVSSAFDAAEVDMSSFAPGRYVVSVKYGGSTFSSNIVKL